MHRKEGEKDDLAIYSKKKCQRQLELIGLVKEEMYTVTEMAKQIKVSRRTILRYLKDLQQKGYVIKEREWHLNYQNKKKLFGAVSNVADDRSTVSTFSTVSLGSRF